MENYFNIFKKISLILLSFISLSVLAASTSEQISIEHPKFSTPLVFNVALPSGYQNNPDKSYIVMFDFHPNSNTFLSGMHDWMSHNGEWPWLQTIIVTPAMGNKVGMLFDATGETTPLIDFFAHQLLPSIDAQYRTNGFRIMSGFRTNGTIVLSTLLNKPNLFNAYIATSPELKNNLAGVLSKAAKKLEQLNDKPRFLLFSHGTNIKEEHQLESYNELKAILSANAPKQLDWHYEHFNDHYFMSLPLLAVITGIEKVFDDIHHGLAPDSDISHKGINAIIEHYQYLSEHKYGFEISPKNSINHLGNYLLNNSPNDGLNIFKKMIEKYPNDAYSHHNLANAFAKLGDFKSAIFHQKDAVALADNMLTWHKKRQRRFLEDYIEQSQKIAKEATHTKN